MGKEIKLSGTPIHAAPDRKPNVPMQLPIRMARNTITPVVPKLFENLTDLDRAFEALLSKKELSVRLSLSESYISQLMAKEALPYFKIGRAVRFRVREVVAWLQKRRRP